MLVSTNHVCLCLLLASAAIVVIAEAFGTVAPPVASSSSSAVRKHDRIPPRRVRGLCLHEGKDFRETVGDGGSPSDVNSSEPIGDEEGYEGPGSSAGGFSQPSATGEVSSSSSSSSLSSIPPPPPPQTSDAGGGDDDDRAGALRKLLESFAGAGNPDAQQEQLPVGSTVVVSGPSLPALGVHEWQSYELVEVYDQGVDGSTGMPVKIPRRDLYEAAVAAAAAAEEETGETLPPPSAHGWKRYARLYSDRYHRETGPVVVSTDEITLVSVRDEVLDSLLMALPVFGFWTALAASFANLYNERYGGTFLDALFRT